MIAVRRAAFMADGLERAGARGTLTSSNGKDTLTLQ
jgi:hypothetical protein